MKLTKEEVAILVQVRENMQRRYASDTFDSAPYICWNLIEVHLGRNTRFDGPCIEVQMKMIGGDVERLFRKISWALGGSASMEAWIGAQTWQYGTAFSLHARMFKNEARLAWLDRIIEMEEIK